MSILLERINTGQRFIEIWLCEPKTNSDEDIEKVLQDLPANVPYGSFAFITTDDGLTVYIKTLKGKWKTV